MSLLLIIPNKSPGLVIVSDDSGLLSRIPPEVAQAAVIHLYRADFLGSGTAVGWWDGEVIHLTPEDWRTAVPTSVEHIVRTARLRRGLHAAPSPPVTAGHGRDCRGGVP